MRLSHESLLDIPLASFLPPQVANILEARKGWLYVRDLRGISEADLKVIPGMDTRRIQEVRTGLRRVLINAEAVT